jgi:hypothetical protein
MKVFVVIEYEKGTPLANFFGVYKNEELADKDIQENGDEGTFDYRIEESEVVEEEYQENFDKLKEVMSEELAGILSTYLSNFEHELEIYKPKNEVIVKMNYNDYEKNDSMIIGKGLSFLSASPKVINYIVDTNIRIETYASGKIKFELKKSE